jgi:hypothetical protein
MFSRIWNTGTGRSNGSTPTVDQQRRSTAVASTQRPAMVDSAGDTTVTASEVDDGNSSKTADAVSIDTDVNSYSVKRTAPSSSASSSKTPTQTPTKPGSMMSAPVPSRNIAGTQPELYCLVPDWQSVTPYAVSLRRNYRAFRVCR